MSLPTAGESIPDVRETAIAAEEAGFDSLWVGDHLSDGRPILESTAALAVAAAVTTRVQLGFGVLQLALRPLAWAAKQIGTLQHLSGHRLALGVGVGGVPPAEWTAAGVPTTERGRRTDEALAVLPRLLAGEPTVLNGVEISLAPAVPAPPVWVGGHSEQALRRAGRYGDGWLAAALPPSGVAAAAHRLASAATPTRVGCVVIASAGGTRSGVADFLSARLGLDPADARDAAVAGTPREMAEQLSGYVDAGVDQLVLIPFGPDWRMQFDQLAEARRLLVGPGVVPAR